MNQREEQKEIFFSLLLNGFRKIPRRIKKLLLNGCSGSAQIFERSNPPSLISGECMEALLGESRDSKAVENVERTIETSYKNGVKIVPYLSKDYPDILREIEDPPLVLFLKGRDIYNDRLSIAVVGARRATAYGNRYAYSISRELARCGVGIVSGMALGIDASAHRGCIDGEGHTVAVLGSGILAPYPRGNMKLFDKICEKGTVVSEFDLFEEPFAQNFPKRNRVVSGLSHGVFVAEAAVKSGAKITARLALEQNREVFVLPGLAGSSSSEGSNDLLKNGLAKLTTCAKDILIEFGHLKNLFNFKEKDCTKASLNGLSVDEKRFLSLLRKGEARDIEELSVQSGMGNERVLDIILHLELKGLIRKEPGNIVCRESQ